METQPTTPTELEKAQQLAFDQWPKEKWGELAEAIETQGDDESKLLFLLLVINGGK